LGQIIPDIGHGAIEFFVDHRAIFEHLGDIIAAFEVRGEARQLVERAHVLEPALPDLCARLVEQVNINALVAQLVLHGGDRLILFFIRGAILVRAHRNQRADGEV
jgi:hypothetical protein